jgi:hypothetical protein
VAVLAIIGVVTLVLVGPALAIASVMLSIALTVVAVLLPFALIGLLVWVPYQMARGNQREAWQRLSTAVSVVAARLAGLAGSAVRLGRWGLRYGHAVLVKAQPAARSLGVASLELLTRGGAVLRRQGPVALRAGLHAGTQVVRSGFSLLGHVVPALRYVGSVATEALAGAGVGALLLALINFGSAGLEERIALGAALGALVGFLVGVIRAKPAHATAEPSE